MFCTINAISLGYLRHYPVIVQTFIFPRAIFSGRGKQSRRPTSGRCNIFRRRWGSNVATRKNLHLRLGTGRYSEGIIFTSLPIVISAKNCCVAVLLLQVFAERERERARSELHRGEAAGPQDFRSCNKIRYCETSGSRYLCVFRCCCSFCAITGGSLSFFFSRKNIFLPVYHT